MGIANDKFKRDRAQSGASLPLALLLFLICALLASVVLSAGSAAAGRQADLVNADQRYYSVASAANLIKDEFCDNPVTISCERKSTRTTTTTFEDGQAKTGAPVNTVNSITLTVDGVSVGSLNADKSSFVFSSDLGSLTLRERTALWIMLGNNDGSVVANTLWSKSSFTTSPASYEVGPLWLNHQVVHNTSSVDKSVVQNVLQAKVTETVNENRGLDFSISTVSTADTNQANMAAMALALATDVDTHSLAEEGTPQVSETATTQIERVDITETHEATLSWSMLYMEKA